MTKFKLFWSTLSRPGQWFIVGALLLTLLFASGIGSGITSWWKERAFNKQLTEEKALREEAIQRANTWEEKAKAEERDKLKHQLANEVAGKAADIAMEKVNAAEQEFNKEMERIGVDATAVERCRNLCSKLKLRLEECGCTEASNGN